VWRPIFQEDGLKKSVSIFRLKIILTLFTAHFFQANDGGKRFYVRKSQQILTVCRQEYLGFLIHLNMNTKVVIQFRFRKTLSTFSYWQN
jgi:hypothetical protein